MPSPIDLIACVATIVAMLASTLTEPQRAHCPRGYYVNGVRPSGQYECRQSPPADDNAPDEIGLYYSARVYCTGGTHPIVVSYHTVGCQR